MSNPFKDEQERKRKDALVKKCKDLISSGNRVQAIAEYRKATGVGLEPAMRALDLR